MTGVILAAGKGSRLGNYTIDLPKSLLPLDDDGYTLLDYNIDILSQLNLKNIIVVTGFNSHKIEDHLSKCNNIEIIYNPFWNHCNVLGSLYMGLKSLNDDFLFLHADTLAERSIWEELVGAEGDMVLPFERKLCGEEEMKMELKNGKVIQITKEMNPESADGEFLGIAKFKKSTIPFFKSTAEMLFKKGELHHYMESVISEAIKKEQFNIRALDILDSNFVEVDFEEDYIRAKKKFGRYNS
ncbi:NTP transferase domain-containing protein [Aestuariivivens sediminicola]|uniref:phosphocholine cytidylyltransferase family protein n=1 Tax=Aestuariivivens sediminicola TaxID=2913560 RepID=UPI001F583AB7|nr:phosphocholine cytidylyltransferase family protein [Aestuariivivens sediminicola]